MKTSIGTLLLTALTSVIIITGCKKDDDTPTPPGPGPAPTPSLYLRLGGDTLVADPAAPGMEVKKGYLAIRSVVDSSIFVIAADPELQPYFAVLLGEVGAGQLTNLAVLSKSLSDFFAVGAGATSIQYAGLNMVDAHNPATNPRMTGLVTNEAHDRFIADVVIGAQQNNVPMSIIQEFGALMESLRSQIVQG
ncbi:MAG: group 1 truncated hemoglobin [Flavobacteriales bacterium]|nr:group 1 truncated hemoglobin [Flavobacteriales bacterium]